MVFGCWLWIATAGAAPTVAITDLRNQTGQAEFDAVGPGVSGILTARFDGSGVVDVVERGAIDTLLFEQELSMEGLTDPRTAARAGRLLGADFLVVGEVFSIQLPAVSVALRVVDTQTSEVVLSREVVGEVGDDGDRFFQLIEQLSTSILDGLQVEETDRVGLTDIERRELRAVQRYGEELTRVDTQHPMALYVEGAGEGFSVTDRRGGPVVMPEFARRVRDSETQQEFVARLRTLRRRARTTNLLAGAYGVVGAGVFVAGTAIADPADPGRGQVLQVTGLGIATAAGLNLVGNGIVQALKRKAAKRPSAYYSPGEVDTWVHRYNRSLRD